MDQNSCNISTWQPIKITKQVSKLIFLPLGQLQDKRKTSWSWCLQERKSERKDTVYTSKLKNMSPSKH